MNKDIARAKKELTDSACSCVLCKNDEIYTSIKNGVAPLLEWIEEKRDFTDFSAADKIVGKASALLLALCGVKAVYASVMSKAALPILTEHNICYEYGRLVDYIQNRRKTGMCPMEVCVRNETDPARALEMLKKRTDELRKQAKEKNMTKVYMTKKITPQALVEMYEVLRRPAHGKTAVKLSSGEPGGNFYLHPEFIEPLVKKLNATIVECNTAYGGGRADTASHEKTMKNHGFTAIAPTDIMDSEGEISLPVVGGTHLKEDIVGSHFENYDFIVNLAHFKGHAMGGFGGVIKNMSIGIASSKGKSLIHSAGKCTTGFSPETPQNDFLESMAEAAKAVADSIGENIVYINVMNNLSVDCDCDSHPAQPTMADIGILASTDPVALDTACVDLVYEAPDGEDLIERIESRNGKHTLDHAEKMGLGSKKYELVLID